MTTSLHLFSSLFQTLVFIIHSMMNTITKPNPNYPLTIDPFPNSSSLASLSSPPIPRRKRSKRTHVNKAIHHQVKLPPSSSSKVISKRKKHAKKPDPSAPKITQPCTECGKTFWSLKALFGHMRCHPERQWRGIISPENLQPTAEVEMNEEEYEVAECLVMLSNGPSQKDESLFGSQQALGGYRATHKNVNGCVASMRSNESEVEDNQINEINGGKTGVVLGLGHKCELCFRVGQALGGGHMRCPSWEKVDEPCINPSFVAAEHDQDQEGCLGLNMPALMDDNEDNAAEHDQDQGGCLDVNMPALIDDNEDNAAEHDQDQEDFLD